jgi:hypothetical protein
MNRKDTYSRLVVSILVIPLLGWLLHAILAEGIPPRPTKCDDLSKLLEALSFGRISCMTFELVGYAFSLAIIGLLVLLLGLALLNIVRCSTSLLTGSFEPEEDENRPTVSIQGAGPLLLYPEAEITGSPILTVEGTGDPPGGTYSWSVLTGTGKVHLEGDTIHSSLSLKPLQKSDSPGDVTIQLTYTTRDGTATARESLTVHTPSSAAQISTRTTTFNGPVEYGYDYTVRYRILDQFGERFPDGFLSLTEELSAILNPYNTTFQERQYVSDANAEYDDHYTLIFNNQPVPADYVAKVRQIVRAQGAQILNHVLVWKSTHVDFE